MGRTETITNGSKLTCGDMGQSNEENSLLLSNSSTVLYNNSASSSDEGEEAMKLYNSMDSNLSFHCHDVIIPQLKKQKTIPGMLRGN